MRITWGKFLVGGLWLAAVLAWSLGIILTGPGVVYGQELVQPIVTATRPSATPGKPGDVTPVPVTPTSKAATPKPATPVPYPTQKGKFALDGTELVGIVGTVVVQVSHESNELYDIAPVDIFRFRPVKVVRAVGTPIHPADRAVDGPETLEFGTLVGKTYTDWNNDGGAWPDVGRSALQVDMGVATRLSRSHLKWPEVYAPDYDVMYLYGCADDEALLDTCTHIGTFAEYNARGFSVLDLHGAVSLIGFRYYQLAGTAGYSTLAVESWTGYGGVSAVCGSEANPCKSSSVLPSITEERGAAMFGSVLFFGLFWLVGRRSLAWILGPALGVCLGLAIYTGQDTWVFAWIVIAVMFAISDFLRNRFGIA